MVENRKPTRPEIQRTTERKRTVSSPVIPWNKRLRVGLTTATIAGALALMLHQKGEPVSQAEERTPTPTELVIFPDTPLFATPTPDSSIPTNQEAGPSLQEPSPAVPADYNPVKDNNPVYNRQMIIDETNQRGLKFSVTESQLWDGEIENNPPLSSLEGDAADQEVTRRMLIVIKKMQQSQSQKINQAGFRLEELLTQKKFSFKATHTIEQNANARDEIGFASNFEIGKDGYVRAIVLVPDSTSEHMTDLPYQAASLTHELEHIEDINGFIRSHMSLTINPRASAVAKDIETNRVAMELKGWTAEAEAYIELVALTEGEVPLSIEKDVAVYIYSRNRGNLDTTFKGYVAGVIGAGATPVTHK